MAAAGFPERVLGRTDLLAERTIRQEGGGEQSLHPVRPLSSRLPSLLRIAEAVHFAADRDTQPMHPHRDVELDDATQAFLVNPPPRQTA